MFQSNSDNDGLPDKITDFIPAIVYVYDADTRKLKYINSKVTDLLGYTYNDLHAWDNDLLSIVHKDDLENVQKELTRFDTLQDEESYSYNSRLTHKSGISKHFRTMGTVLNRDTKGRAATFLFIAQDITGEVESGNQFKRIDELFNDTQELLKFGVWEWSVPDNKISWSNGLYKILGYDPKTEKDKLHITPEFYLQHVLEADRDKVLYNRKDFLVHHEYDLYYKIFDRNGRAKDVREKAKVFRNEKDELLRVIGSTIDITEQSQLYRDLAAYKAMKQENEAFLDYGTWEMDARTGNIFWSDGMYRLFGYDPETDKNKVVVNEALYQKHMNEEHFENSRSFVDSIIAQKEHPENYVAELEIKTNDGSVKRIETSAKFFYDNEGRWIKTIGTSRNITRLHHYQSNLEEKIKDLDRSNKELEEFAYVASHDMNEPLRKITTFIERLESKYKSELGADGKLYLARISASVENMRHLIDTLLEFSRTARTNQPFVQVDLNAILKEVQTDLELKIEETSTTIHIDALPAIQAIPSQMKQLFDNLLNNSIKFRKADTHPVINIRCMRLTRRQKEQHHLDTENTWFKIEFADNGIGFEPEYKERIFQIFQRLHGKTEYPGSGIGLAICKKIIDQHKGLIYATGEPDNGATFTIILPEHQ
ncbi:PAS domain-containing sensor histidine kinase [Longitalea luteola]|uniref:PAS domain-containing sensor histidine kinase n=1 Tax=Longitalea luteola TaxID=2812563 RepID=UPI001A9730E1|nr:PAS domain-containing sensor histidine kinase [Longitalea luteola]